MHRTYAFLVIISWALLLWPFPGETFMAACFACLLRPLYVKMLSRWKASLATVIMGFGLSIGVMLPIAIVVLMVTPQAVHGLALLNDLQKSGWIYGPEMQSFFDTIDTWLRQVPGMEGGIRQITTELTSFLAASIQTVVSRGLGIAGSTMSFMVRVCILISLSMIGILYAPYFTVFIKKVTRFPEDVLNRFTIAVRQAIRAVLWGVLLVACIQGLLCGIGFAVASLPGAAFWGLVAAFVAPIPLLGTGIVWLPASIYLWFAVSKGVSIGLMIWCVLIVVGADNLLRPLFLRGGLNTSFAVVLISILCGLVALGPVGIVAGPVLAAFALQAAREVEIAGDD